MKKSALILALTTPVVSGCSDELCADGVLSRSITLNATEYVLHTDYAGTPTSRFPYNEGSPFLNCLSIPGLRVISGDARLESEDFPLLEELGGISVLLQEAELESINGFDSLHTFGGIAGEFLPQPAHVRTVSGFNNVERIEGPLLIDGDVEGFSSLREVGGDVAVSSLDTLSKLERVGGNFTVRSGETKLDLSETLVEVGGSLEILGTQITSLGFPALERVGGNFDLHSNALLSDWRGLRTGATVQGNYIAIGNRLIENEVFIQQVVDDNTVIDGILVVCNNVDADDPVEESCDAIDLPQ